MFLVYPFQFARASGNGTTPEVEQSILENGTIKGVGNVTSLGTRTNTDLR
ncbi:MAG TPA: hypothetical protein VFI70_00755 [Nitrososphaeraceae archaeon]|nr:hypothetical protein [Nitrososphaeraceae archaeon]